MKLFKENLLFLFCLSFFITVSHAAELQQGVQYNGGDYLTASKAGISFTIPQGWSGSVSNDGDFIMKSNLFICNGSGNDDEKLRLGRFFSSMVVRRSSK